MCCGEPAPLPVPKRIPGSFFASATSSAIDLTPSDGCEASTIGWREIRMTGVKSRSGS